MAGETPAARESARTGTLLIPVRVHGGETEIPIATVVIRGLATSQPASLTVSLSSPTLSPRLVWDSLSSRPQAP